MEAVIIYFKAYVSNVYLSQNVVLSKISKFLTSCNISILMSPGMPNFHCINLELN